VKAADLVPHELNPRTHSDAQRSALQALYNEIGFARSLLAYELPDGRLKLIDGHLRQSMDPDMEVDVEVLDVNDQEARALLLSIDPLAQLAGYDNETLAELRRITHASDDLLTNLWHSLGQSEQQTENTLKQARKKKEQTDIPEMFMVLIECETEQEQIKLLRRFKREGLKCSAKTV